MRSVRLFGIRQRRRTLVASMLLLLALAVFVALPANAGKPGGTAPTTTWSAPACTSNVTYTWSGIRGGVDAYLRVLFANGNVALVVGGNNAAVSTSSGTVTLPVTIKSGSGTQSYFARGSLFNSKNQEIRGSVASSGSTPLTC